MSRLDKAKKQAPCFQRSEGGVLSHWTNSGRARRWLAPPPVEDLDAPIRQRTILEPVRTLMLLLFSGTVASAFQQPSPRVPWDVGLGPILESTYMKDAVRHAETAHQLEINQDWGRAGWEYGQIIQDAQAALHANPESAQDPTIYYTLGLAEADAARMFRYEGAAHFFPTTYTQHLVNADQFLRTAASLYVKAGIPVWPVFSALAMVQTLQGDFSGAQSDVQRAQTLNPQYQPAAAALQELDAVPQPVAQAASVLRTNSNGLTDAQWKLIEGFGKTVALALLPRQYRTAATLSLAGFELLRQLQKSNQAPQPHQ